MSKSVVKVIKSNTPIVGEQEQTETPVEVKDRMAKARAAKREKRGTQQTTAVVQRKGDLVAQQIEAIDDPFLQRVYAACVTETLKSQAEGWSGVTQTKFIQKVTGAGTYDALQELVAAGVLKQVVLSVGYVPVLLDKGTPEKKQSKSTGEVSIESLMTALRSA